MDLDALAAVDLLDLVDQVLLAGSNATDLQDLLGIQGTLGQLGAGLDGVAVGHPQPGSPAHRILGFAFLGIDHDPAALFVVDDLGGATDLGHDGLALGGTSLEQLDDPGEAMGDVLTGDAAGVEGTHGQLGAGLTDRLGGHDPDRFADLDHLAGGKGQPVAALANAERSVAGQRRPDPQLGDGLGGLDQLELLGPDQGAGLELDVVALDQLLVDLDVVGQDSPEHPRTQVADPATPFVGGRHSDPAIGLAVDLLDDHFLGDVDQTPGEIPGVGGAQGRVGQTLADTVGGDEVLQHRQAFSEVGHDRPRDDVALGVGDQASHTGDLADLQHVPAGAGADHHVERVELLHLEVGLHGVLDLVRRLGPDLDQLLAPLLLGDNALLILRLDLVGPGLILGEDLRLVLRGLDVLEPDRETGPGRESEPEVLDRVEGRGDVGTGVVLDQHLDQSADVGLRHHVVDEREVLGEGLVDQGPTQSRHE